MFKSGRAVLEVIWPSTADHAGLKKLAESLFAAPGTTCGFLQGPGDMPLPLPAPLHTFLRDAVMILLDGDAVAISPLHKRLSTAEAGDLLGVSRQHLTRLIERGEIPCDRLGHRLRLKLGDVLEFKSKRDSARRATLNGLTAEAASLGIYD